MSSLQEWQEEILRKSSCKKPKPITHKVFELIEWSRKDPIGFLGNVYSNGWLIEPAPENKTDYMRWSFIQYWYRTEVKKEYVEPIANDIKTDEKGQGKLL